MRLVMRMGRDPGGRGIHLQPGRPLLADSARPWAGALLACCAILVAVLGVLFAHQARADWLDHAFDSPIITWLGGHPGLALWLAAPGSLMPVGVLSAAIVVACLLTGRLNGAVLAAAAVPAAVGLDEGLLKHYFTDTVAGAAVGIGTVCGLTLILDRPAARRWLARASRQQPTALSRPEVRSSSSP